MLRLARSRVSWLEPITPTDRGSQGMAQASWLSVLKVRAGTTFRQPCFHPSRSSPSARVYGASRRAPTLGEKRQSAAPIP